MERLAMHWTAGFDFVAVYAVVLLGSVILAPIVRWTLREPRPTRGDRMLDVYEVAYLQGGARRSAAIVGAGVLFAVPRMFVAADRHPPMGWLIVPGRNCRVGLSLGLPSILLLRPACRQGVLAIFSMTTAWLATFAAV